MSYSENGNAAFTMPVAPYDLMDAAGSEYERQELKRYIGMIRQAGMTD